ncbi:aminotransferase class I/II-fold pyridoxal phosphate-dependent enzyme [Methylacidiphilum kamchatkense]|uniref:8-amino-7-oxononanoate synthase n=1 Tax=Methylacidiphilum kamchatkense Kam1 TaxID=1202785 RepID=A0A516TN83_9BACT|nr:8-amino-7-oxononanoate synthase [Methylacidiphilum kamchatkense]QDQ42691.1 8-amino-7-oxononanoate synthase [Methylacidiphilum kamchatkense Kam1]
MIVEGEKKFIQKLAKGLDELKNKNLLRRLKDFRPIEGMRAEYEGKQIINFSSNDYLGLSQHPLVKEKAQQAIQEYGASCSASRLISGNNPLFSPFEKALAQWKGKEKALIFPTGYSAAIGTIPALVGKSDLILMDKHCHASLWDGARLSQATIRVFGHNDVQNLKQILDRYTASYEKILIISESIFSMDGDVAPLAEMIELKERYEGLLLLDDAHAEGIVGEEGNGLASCLQVMDKVDVFMGTFSKALGSQGGYIASSALLIDWVINKGRSFIFSTALSPSSIAAACSALHIIKSESGTELRKKLKDNVAYFLEESPNSRLFFSPLIPILIGEEAKAIQVSQELEKIGIYLPPIRYPTVPKGTARLRISLTALHSTEQIDYLKGALKKCLE